MRNSDSDSPPGCFEGCISSRKRSRRNSEKSLSLVGAPTNSEVIPGNDARRAEAMLMSDLDDDIWKEE